MTESTRRAYGITRLTQCPDLAALQRVWEGLGDSIKRDPEVIACKDRLKAELAK